MNRATVGYWCYGSVMANPRVDPTDETVLLRVKIPKRLDARLRDDAAAARMSLSELVRSRLSPATVIVQMDSSGNTVSSGGVVEAEVVKAARAPALALVRPEVAGEGVSVRPDDSGTRPTAEGSIPTAPSRPEPRVDTQHEVASTTEARSRATARRGASGPAAPPSGESTPTDSRPGHLPKWRENATLGKVCEVCNVPKRSHL